MRHYCTYFDSNYLSRGLVLYESLCTHEKEFTLYVLCLDGKTFNFFQRHHFDKIIPITLDEFEKGDTKLTDCISNRSKVEYIFTCTPSLLIYILNAYHSIELLTYLDSDLFFFSSPDPIFKEIGISSIAIMGHRFSERNKWRECYGIYNVGFLSFRNDIEGRKCLNWWRDKCIEWCFDREEDGRFADQKYLDVWPVLFNNVCIVKHKGANLAPWNIDNYEYTISGGTLLVGEEPLIVYHFHGLNALGRHFFKTNIESYCDNVANRIIFFIYSGYIRYLKKFTRKFDTPVCVTRNHDFSTDSIIKLAVRSEIICHLCMLPTFSLSRIVRLFLPIYKLFLSLEFK